MKKLISRRLIIAALIVTNACIAVLPLSPVLAHEADCPYCQMPVTQDTATQDNEVKLRYGQKRIEYKCVYCALAESKTAYAKGDVTIAAPSEKKGSPVILKRTDGKWSATPATAVFVAASRPAHKVCQVQYRSFTNKAAAQAYAAKNDVKVLSLAEMIALAK